MKSKLEYANLSQQISSASRPQEDSQKHSQTLLNSTSFKREGRASGEACEWDKMVGMLVVTLRCQNTARLTEVDKIYQLECVPP